MDSTVQDPSPPDAAAADAPDAPGAPSLASVAHRVFAPAVVCAIAFLAGIKFGYAHTGWWCHGWRGFLYAWCAVALPATAYRKSWPILAALLGVVLAWHSHLADAANLRRCLWPKAGTEFSLPVDRTLALRYRNRGKRWYAPFESHIGSHKISVGLPLQSFDSPRPRVGEVWRTKGRFFDNRRSRNDRLYLRAYVNSSPHRAPDDETIPDRIKGLYARLACDLSENCNTGLKDRPHLAELNRSILLGDRAHMDKAELDAFRASGTIHIFAVSGLHVAIVAMLVELALRLIIPKPNIRTLVLLPILVVYVGVTGARPSALRALAMLVCYFGADAFNRQRSAPSALGATALLLYAADPALVCDTGATFSFAVMGGIAFALEAMRGVPPLFRSRIRIPAATFGIGAVAWASGVPVAANTFGIITPIAVVAGPLVMSITGIQMSFAAAGMVAASVWTPLAAALNNIAAFLMSVMAWICKTAADLPFGHMKIGRIPPWGVALWYVGVAAAVLAIRRHLATRAQARATPKPL